MKTNKKPENFLQMRFYRPFHLDSVQVFLSIRKNNNLFSFVEEISTRVEISTNHVIFTSMEHIRNKNYQRVDRLIVDSFCDLLKGNNERSITITELCQNAGVNRTTFYKHYQGIWQIIDKLEEQLIEGMEGDKPSITAFLNNPYPRFQELNRILEQDIDFYRRLFNTQHVEKIMNKINAMVLKSALNNEEIMKKYKNVNHLKIAIDINIGVIVHLYLSWFKNNYGNATLDDIAQIASRAIRHMNTHINSK